MANITGDSVEAIALELLERVAAAEGWTPTTSDGSINRMAPWRGKSKDQILDAYADCLKAANGQRGAIRP
jgi:hypothetical protein